MTKVLVIDVGGTNVKVLIPGREAAIKIPSGPEMTAHHMVHSVLEAAVGVEYDAVSIGYPGPVVHGCPELEPKNIGGGWVGFDFASAFGKPVQVINDAAMQALGSFDGGCMLFLGLGTGLGSAMIIEGVIAPMELAHLPYRKGKTFEDYVGSRGLARLGKKKWQRAVEDVVFRLKSALIADYVVLGGGNAKLIDQLPPNTRLGSNQHALQGGLRLWESRTPAPSAYARGAMSRNAAGPILKTSPPA